MAPPLDTVILSEMADRLNKEFARHLDGPISKLTPYDWWDRSKAGTISLPMPKPITYANRGGVARGTVGDRPVFRWSDVVRWYIKYRGANNLNIGITIEEDG